MLKSRRNHGTKELLQEAARTGAGAGAGKARRRRGRGVVKLVIAGVAGWAMVNVVRKAQQAGGREPDTELAETKAAAKAQAKAQARTEAETAKARAKAPANHSVS
jgi:hypothetical protein